MIFADVRISQLRREAEGHRASLVAGYRRLTKTLREKANPITFAKEHPALLAGALVSLISARKVLKKAQRFPFANRAGLLWRLLEFGWTWKVSGLVKSAFSSSVVPAVITTVRSILRHQRRARSNGASGNGAPGAEPSVS